MRARRGSVAVAIATVSVVVGITASLASVIQPSGAQTSPSSTVIFGDTFADGFSLNPWVGTVDAASTGPVQAGTTSIKVNLDPWSGAFINVRDGLALQGAMTLSLWVHGGTAGAIGVRVFAKAGFNDAGPGFEIPEVPAGTWRRIDVPLSALVTNPAGYDAATGRSFAVLAGAIARPAIWLDTIELSGSAPSATTTTTTVGPTTTTTPAPTTTVASGVCQTRSGPIEVMLVGDSLTVGGYGDGNGGGTDPAKRFRDSYRYELWRLLSNENRSPFLLTGHSGQAFSWGYSWGGEPPIGSGLTEFAHSGVGWISIEEVIAQFRTFLAGPVGGHPVRPDVVVVNLGSNIKATPNPRGLVSEIKAALPNSVILLTTMPINLAETSAPASADRAALRSEWMAIGNESPTDRVVSSDIFATMKAGGALSGPVVAADFADGTHFNISGGAKFAGAMLAGVRDVIERSGADRCGTHAAGGPTTTTTTTVLPSTTTTLVPSATTTVAPSTTSMTTVPASSTTTRLPPTTVASTTTSTTSTTTTRPSTTTTRPSTTTTTTRPSTTTTRPSTTTTTTLPPPAGGVLYGDQLGPNVYDWSWAARNLASTNPARGTRAILFEPDSWSALVLHAEPVTVSATRLTFSLHGGTTGAQVIRLFVSVNGVGRVELDLSAGLGPVAGAWKDYTILLPQPIVSGQTVDISWQAWTGANQSAVSLDDVVLVP